MKIKALRNTLLIIAALFVLTGCKTAFKNLTNDKITVNPSGIYTFSFSAETVTTNLVEGTETAEIVINEETYPMTKSPDQPMTFTFDYKMPEGQNEVRYYYILRYDYANLGDVNTAVKNSFTEEGMLYQSRLINRYPIQLVSNRGPVGTRIALVGSGFSSSDSIIIGNSIAETEIFSTNSLEFVVPPLPAGELYDISLQTGSGDIKIGKFRIDAAQLSVQPEEIFLNSGDIDFLIFEIGSEATLGGLPIEVTTDIPTSVIMPEVVIPEGARSVNVNIEGGEPGSGSLKVSASGYDVVTIPVTVQ